jgi:pimeloyl-ACP methyl ester carboxylesterase/tetratricopeptide (TPR) repeat protein
MKEANSHQTLLIEGSSNPDTPRFPDELRGLLRAEPSVRTFVMAAPERGSGAEGVQEVVARPDEIMELEMEDGIRLWMTVEEYLRDFAPQEQRGAGSVGSPLRIGASLSMQTRERGLFKWIVKGLSLIGIDLAEGSAEKLAQLIDTKKGLNGLYNVSLAADRLTLNPLPPFSGGSEPLLVFIHGTMSSTEGSFGGLWSDRADVRQRLAGRYGERVCAFEHKTFTESPLDNALALAGALPDGATLHLVSHSRGGMIGELLCRSGRSDAASPFDDKDLRLFSDPACVEKLRRLNKLLSDKKLRIERFVRVACPARGTTLASRRLDRCISLLSAGLSSLDRSGWVGDITWFAASVIRERTDPKVMPGIEAMMPDSPMVKLLNRPGVTVGADLRVIAGDYDGSGILGRLGDWATEGFFGGETDVVVNTPSMYGGARRRDGGWYACMRGPQVWHFSYFKQVPSAARLADGLLLDKAADAGFSPLDAAPDRDAEIARGIVLDLFKEEWGSKLEQRFPSEKCIKPIAVIVPGIMGTHLQVAGERIWLDFDDIIEGKFQKLGIGEPGVVTDGIVTMAYGDFVDFLGESHETLVFPFDWRRSLREEGARFALFMANVVGIAEKQKRPVRVVAHSMGGLLTRMAAVLTAEEGGTDWWARLKGLRGSRLVMAGTPNGGSWIVPFVLTGRDGVIKNLALLDLFHSKNDLIKIVSRFEGFLEMLPADSACFDPDTWKKWRVKGEEWLPPDPALLAKCAVNRSLLDRFDFRSEADFVCYLAGHDDATPQAAEVAVDGGKPRLRFLSTGKGDGRVLWATGIPAAKGVGVWYIPVKHGDLLNHPESFPGIREVMDTGATSLMASEPPVTRSADGALFTEASIPYYPDAGMLCRGVLGMASRSREAGARVAAASPLKVSVCHGDLTAARHAVAVGHYAGDSITGAEAALDARLGGALQRRHLLGVYPGTEGSCDIFASETSAWGAIVIGLGQVGDLTATGLSRSFTDALLRYVTRQPLKEKVETPGSFRVSSTLIGSGRGWGLGIKESIRALIEGTRHANELLSVDGHARIIELEFLELFEDRAIQALKAARELSLLGFAGPVEIIPTLRTGEGGRCRACGETPDGWWQRIKIEETDDGSLKFSIISGLARIDEQLQARQKTLIDQLIDNAISSLTVSRQEMFALYNLVTPNSVKDQAANQGDLLLMLDPKAAGYPWEMMHVGGPPNPQPLALRAGLIRQLALKDCRQRPSYSSGLRALVVADPALPDGCPFQRLSGALSEGKAVSRALSDEGVDVRGCLGAGSGEIITALFNGEYRFLHLAGHGVYRCDQIDATGMVIDWRSPSLPVLLTRVEIKQMNRVPELVFINCCHLGVHPETGETTSLKDINRFAGDLATAFIEMGVRAVIAAGWAVSDNAAEEFATTFYRKMLEGRSFGDAVRAARNAAANSAGATNTWAAYQCYGDPGYRLHEHENHSLGKVYLSPGEALYDIRALSVQVRDDQSGTTADAGKMLRELERISAAIPHDWYNRNGALRDALGAAYAAHGDFDAAIEQYRAAALCNDGSCSLRAVEQLFNLRVRSAAKKSYSTDKELRKQIADIEKEVEDFTSLLARIGDTKERCSLLGSACKRLIELKMKLKKDPEKDGTVQAMIDWYAKAMELDPSDPYAALNWAAGLAVRHISGTAVDRDGLVAVVKRAGEIGCQENERNPNFWSAIHAIDADFFLLLMEDLSDKGTARKTDGIIEHYKAQFALNGNTNTIDSVKSQFDFYLLFSGDKNVEKFLKQVKKGLQGK